MQFLKRFFCCFKRNKQNTDKKILTTPEVKETNDNDEIHAYVPRKKYVRWKVDLLKI